ncbi:MAG: ATP synthase F1 subunit gamma [Candidatus Gracilibacteria bacterium]|jgi:F-type H+-transporting ATPase subunit gamma
MPSSGKEIKRKIKSINSTRQITKAMELVATSKMKKAVDNAVKLRSYGYLALNLLSKLSKKQAKLHKYFRQRKVKNILLLVLSTDKGLCGGLNANIYKKIIKTVKVFEEQYKDAKIHYLASGKKGAEFLHRIGKDVEFVFPAYSANPKFSDIFPLSKIALRGFENGTYEKVVVIYPDFISTLLQKPVAKTLLPFSIEVLMEMLSELGSKFSKFVKPAEKDIEYKLEPSPKYILENIVPQLTEMQLYQAVLEMSASEHSARMVAMQNANQAAEDLLNDLVLTYNQARQAAITAEIAEIAAASSSLNN